MQKTVKRILSLALVLAMMLSLSITAWADDDETADPEEAAEPTTEVTPAPDPEPEPAPVPDPEPEPVPVPAPEPASITLYPKTLQLDVGDREEIEIDVSGTDGQAISWSSSNDRVATVLGGKVTAEGAGTAIITASVAGVSDTCTVHVTEKLPELDPLYANMDPQSVVMNEGETETLTANPYGGTGSFTYSWRAYDDEVVRVSGSGKSVTISAVGGGTTTVVLEVRDSGTGETSEATCSVRVNAKARPTSTTYSYSGSTRMGGSGLAMNSVASAMESKFRSDLGVGLDYGATVYLYNMSSSVGRFTHNGQELASGTQQFAIFESMVFEPYGPGSFSTGYEIQQYDSAGSKLTISGTISITVTGGTSVSSVTMEASGLEMATYSSNYLDLYINPGNADYSVSWTSSNSNIVRVSGSGKTGTLQSYGTAGAAVVTATVTDANGGVKSASCTVTVKSAATYNPTLTVIYGSDYSGTDTSDNMAYQFRNVYGYALNYNNAVISFASVGDTRYGVLRTPNGRAISANTNYTFNEWVNIWFEPVAPGTFTIPYTLTYNGDSLTGTFTIYIRGASVTPKLSTTSLSLATYSNSDLTLTVTPSNARYSVQWLTSNSKIATVTGNSYVGRVETKDVAGTVTITARVTDANGVSVDKQCTVTVTNSATYNPSVSTYIGVSYTGTGTSDAMIKQFRSVYGVTLDNKATIRFSSTGNNSIGVMRLKNGTAIKANTNYTMADYIKMYTEPVATGTFTIPYTLTYNNNSLTGSVNVVINGVNINSAVELANTNAYTFSSAAANGAIGSTLFGNSITNAIGSSWQYIRFGTTSGTSVGTLYRNTNRSALGTANIYKSDLSSLYFVPSGTNGTYSVAYTVYNANGGAMSNGTLSITEKGGTTASTITFADINPNDPNQQWVIEPVRWAVSKGITNGMSFNKAGQPQFEPNTTCNNAQIITFLWRSQGSPAPTISNPFTDVTSDKYFYSAAVWAYEKGIVSGTTFGETTPCTRAMVVTYMWRLAGKPSAATANFGDVPSSGETASAIAWAVAHGITNGMGNDATGRPTFQPNTICNRGQIVTFLQRAYA